jgi:hypothetical protein
MVDYPVPQTSAAEHILFALRMKWEAGRKKNAGTDDDVERHSFRYDVAIAGEMLDTANYANAARDAGQSTREIEAAGRTAMCILDALPDDVVMMAAREAQLAAAPPAA